MLRYAITDRTRSVGTESARRKALLQQASVCARGGVDYLQLREKDLQPGQVVGIARDILKVLRAGPSRRTRLLINSRADVAVASRAHGVHLTSAADELTPEQVARLYASAYLPLPITSMSCHSLAEVVRARMLAPSMILFGPVFEKVVGQAETLISTGTGLNLLKSICCAAAPVPVLALGGVTDENTPDCLAAGAAGIAGIRLFAIQAADRQTQAYT